MGLVEQIYLLCLELPADERFGLTSQIRRAAISIPTNIAEGFGRESSKSFAQFVRISLGSSYELSTLLQLTHRLNLAGQSSLEKTLRENSEIGRMLKSFLHHLERRQSSVQEAVADYGDGSSVDL